VTLVVPGSVILVTGATGSIGFEIAAEAAEAGAVVGVHGSRPESVADAAQRLRARAPEARLIEVPADFLTPGAVEAVVRQVTEEAGRLDAVIHCAIGGFGGRITGLFHRTEPEAYGPAAQAVLAVFERLCFAALPHLARQGGTIIGFASDAGRFAAARQSVMGGIYAGIMGFVRNLAVEAAREGVRVHCISPSFVADTRIFDRYVNTNGRPESARDRAGLGLPTPRDIAPLALFLCGPGAARITGQVISVNGGLNA
jgi:3-oxoacyl-[acyl-carrier protein] reductase